MPRWFVLCRRRRRAQAGKTKKWWGCRPLNRTKHPHHQKRRPGNTNPQTGQHSPVHSLKETVGSALLSHNPPVAVPSAQKGLTSRFGKDTGCNPLAKTTNTTNKQHPKQKGETQVSETIIHLTTQPTNPQTRGARGRVGREPHSGRKHPKNTQQVIVSYRSISTSKLVTLQCLHS